MGEAIELTSRLYPDLLEENPNLMFALKCRQFVEMVNGSDSEVCQSANENQTSVIQSTKAYTKASANGIVDEMNLNNTINGSTTNEQQQQFINGQIEDDVDMEENTINSVNGVKSTNGYQNGSASSNGFKCQNGEDVDMGTCFHFLIFVKNVFLIIWGGFNEVLISEVDGANPVTQQAQQQNGSYNGSTTECTTNKSNKKQLCGGNKQAIEKMLEFGKQLYSQSIHLRQLYGKNESNKKMLQDAFSLLAYSNPWASPVGWQLDPQQRETVCARLNSAILGTHFQQLTFCTILT